MLFRSEEQKPALLAKEQEVEKYKASIAKAREMGILPPEPAMDVSGVTNPYRTAEEQALGWKKDENGIPIRQDQPFVNPYDDAPVFREGTLDNILDWKIENSGKNTGNRGLLGEGPYYSGEIGDGSYNPITKKHELPENLNPLNLDRNKPKESIETLRKL